MKDKLRLKVLVGMSYEFINITSSQYKKLIDYGKCKTDEQISVLTESGYPVTSSIIDDYELA